MRLIDADELKKKLFFFDMEFHDGHHQKHYVYKEKDVDAAPTIDAVEVVRCCNCKWSKEHSGRLFCTNGYNARAIDPYGFCERGKR